MVLLPTLKRDSQKTSLLRTKNYMSRVADIATIINFEAFFLIGRSPTRSETLVSYVHYIMPNPNKSLEDDGVGLQNLRKFLLVKQGRGS